MNNITVLINKTFTRTITSQTSLLELSQEFSSSFSTPIVAAIVNGEEKSLHFKLDTDQTAISFLELQTPIGMRIYSRSLIMLLQIALKQLKYNLNFSAKHNLGDAIYCELAPEIEITANFIAQLKEKMLEIVASNTAIEYNRMPKQKACDLFHKLNLEKNIGLIKYLKQDEITYYSCLGISNYFFSPLVPFTGILKIFDVLAYRQGILIRYPKYHAPTVLQPYKNQTKLADIFEEASNWAKLIECDTVSDLNNKVVSQEFNDIISISEALHEKKIAEIADKIKSDSLHKRLILIAGPSSSGKTTFTKRLNIQLRVNGLKPANLSIDDYFLSRSHTPRKSNGDYDFESIYAIDLKLFNEHLCRILRGERVKIPTFNFVSGCTEYRGNSIQLEPGQPILVEGIHALNEQLTASIAAEYKLKIYVSAITGISLDPYNRIRTTDCRLLRRIVRDSQFRAHDARETLRLWPSVRAGEEENIFPYQEDADIMFNTSLLYELLVIKQYATELLNQVTSEQDEYSEARRLLNLLNHVLEIDKFNIPDNSILKEFIG